MRSGLAPDPLPLRDRLALERTRLANERTLLAYVRTALALIAGGVTLLFFAARATHIAGYALLGFGAVVIALGFARFDRVRRRVTAAETRSVEENRRGEAGS